MAQNNAASPTIPWKTRITIGLLSAVTDFSRRSDGTVNRRLLNFFDRQTRPSNNPAKGVVSRDVSVDSTRGLWFRSFTPSAAADNLPVIIYFHGGGFTFLSPASELYHNFAHLLSRKIPAVVVSVNYRLSPEHKFPAPYDDGIEVLKFLDANGLESGDLSNCFLAGDSAGGNIAHHVSVRWAAANWSKVRLRGVFSIQPFFGGVERTESELRLVGAPLVSTERTDWHWKVFLPEGDDRDHEAVNVFGPRGVKELPANFPAVAVVVGGFDPLQDWQKRYYDGLVECGCEAKLIWYERAIHVFGVFPQFQESAVLVDEMRQFVDEHLMKDDFEKSTS